VRQAARGQEELDQWNQWNAGRPSEATCPSSDEDWQMTKITIILVLISGFAIAILAPVYAHASVIQTSARDSSTGPFNPNVPAEARTRSGS
jgi:hypothetical protein